MARVSFTLYAAAGGAPVAGLSVAVTLLRRINSDGSVDAITPLPTVVDGGGGLYTFVVDQAFFRTGATIRYIVDSSAASASRYIDGELDGPDVDVTAGTAVEIVPSNSAYADFRIKLGDTLPAIQQKLVSANGAVVDLSGATVKFRMQDPGRAVIVDNQAAVIVDPATATVRYLWQSDDTAAEGLFYGEWVVTVGSDVQTFPARGYVKVLVSERLGP